MEIRFECECYNRTLVITIPKRYIYLSKAIIIDLNQYYDEWLCFETEETETMCLEEYIMYKLSEQLDIDLTWHVEDDEYEL